MKANPDFQNALSLYGWQIPYFCFTQTPDVFQNIDFHIQNMPFYPYCPSMWNPINETLKSQQQVFGKTDDSQAVDLTSAGSKSQEVLQKPKRIQAPRIRPTKNNESNICNQAFSFMTNQTKSRNILEKLFENKAKAQIFYDYSKCLSSKRKKYMSKNILLSLCTLTQSISQIQQTIKHKKLSILTLKEFESGVRFLILYFLRHKSTLSILTSQKIASNLKKEHFTKVREILNFVEEGLENRRDIAKNS